MFFRSKKMVRYSCCGNRISLSPNPPLDLGEVAGFSLLEIMASVAVVAILASIAMPMYASFQGKAQRMRCAENIKSLGLGLSSYLEDHRQWPQIAPSPSDSGTPGDSPEATQWIQLLTPYGLGERNWRCPTIESQVRRQGNPLALKAKRIDYTPTTFPADPAAPRQWPRHPWLVERGAPHGTGPLVLLADGSLVTFEDIFGK